MPRLPHGLDITSDTVSQARDAVAGRVAEDPLASFTVKRVEFERRFDFLFPELQDDDDNLLPVARKTRNDLVKLGLAMADEGGDDAAGDMKKTSAAYTYFGQFVDHDITLEKSAQPGMKPPVEGNLKPLPLEFIREQTENLRTALLELDSVYNLPAERDPQDRLKMRIGKVSDLGEQPIPGSRPQGKADENDLPREGRSADVKRDRAALIGDPRNDENTIIAQLHLAFLLAHNRLVDEANPPNRFMKAKRRLRRHYQHIVLHDFLKQIADEQIVHDTIENGNRVYVPDEDEFFMPLEFSTAAYRFGHSMVRAAYDFNVNFNRSGPPGGKLGFLFTFTALSGQLGFPGGETKTLPENWIIEWENFFDPGGGKPNSIARRIDTELVEPLQHLQTLAGEEEGEGDPRRLAASLAVRNLLRGYQLRMPTGQAVARTLRRKLQGVRNIPVLTAQQIRSAASRKQREVLDATEFLERTPLWYYILAEAAVLGDEGQHLGPVGSTIVAEVLVGLVRRSPDSILDPDVGWQPYLPSNDPGKFTLADLLRFAGVLAD